jgi:hypothetical protein
MRKYTKMEAAEKQLFTAVRLFLEDSDPVPVETLCGAVLGILHPLADHHGIVGMLKNPDLISPGFEKLWRQKLNEAPNFLKHADRDWDAEINYNPDALPYKLFEAVALHEKVNAVVFKATKKKWFGGVFMFWFSINYPQLVNKNATSWKAQVKEVAERLPPSAGKAFFLSLLMERSPSSTAALPAPTYGFCVAARVT